MARQDTNGSGGLIAIGLFVFACWIGVGASIAVIVHFVAKFW
jgi:hypothetical protein